MIDPTLRSCRRIRNGEPGVIIWRTFFGAAVHPTRLTVIPCRSAIR
jgi:hypothetical protein